MSTPHHQEQDDPSESSSSDDQEEFDFITSQWENGVEVGLRLDWPGSRRPITINTKLTEDRIAPLFDGTQWAGTRVWKAAVVALEYLLEAHPEGGSLLELGCGLGVPGMLWHLLHEEKREQQQQPRVVLTDMPDLLPQLEANMQNNFEGYYGRSIQAKDLDWSIEGIQKLWKDEGDLAISEDGNNRQRKIFDICLNCDCIYEPLYGRESWESLADVLAEISRQSPDTVLISSVERRTADGLENFIERLQATGVVESVQRVLRNEEDPHHIIEVYVTKGKR